ncbi:hypothetical protein T09_1380 [Trichinella sp. T9]|nr:hypothetical protein T09_1380 [Trichinella sp. T9]
MELLGRDATGSIAALFSYFRVEWMPPDRLPMWNLALQNEPTCGEATLRLL